MLRGTLSDDFGNYSFSAQVKVINEIPNGSIPEEDCTVLDGERILNLDEFFTDPNGDILTYSVTGVQEGVEVGLEESPDDYSKECRDTYCHIAGQ